MKESLTGLAESVKGGVFSRARALIPMAVDIQGLSTSWAIESVRSYYVNPSSDPMNHSNQPALDYDKYPELFEALSHGGNGFEGYLYPFSIYYALSMISPKIPENVRKYTAAGVGFGTIAAYELGYIYDKIPDPLDVPAGAIGAIAFLGLHSLGTRFINERLPEDKLMID